MIILESLDALYQQLRGSRCSTPILEVRSLVEEGKYAEAMDQLRKVRELYENTRKSTLAKNLDGNEHESFEAQLLKKRQGKAIDALGRFSQLLGMLSMELRRIQPPPVPTTVPKQPEAPKPESQANEARVAAPVAPSQPADDPNVDPWVDKLSSATIESEIFAILDERFARSIPNQQHVFQPNELWAILAKGVCSILITDDPPVLADQVRMRTWKSRQRLVPIPLDKFIRSIQGGRAYRLLPNQPAVTPPSIQVDARSIQPQESIEDDKPIVSETAVRDQVLDMGAFTQLLDAAQRSGIVPGSGVIVQVRDGEYRLGKYHKALQMIESLYAAFMASEMQRNQRLQREDADISCGRKKLSQRELIAKRVQDNQGTQAIDRAKVRFQRVLEGLRGLLYLENTNRPSEPESELSDLQPSS